MLAWKLLDVQFKSFQTRKYQTLSKFDGTKV